MISNKQFLNNFSLKTGDLLLFSGKSVLSNLIKLFTRSRWSHIGMIFRSSEGSFFCFEADVDSMSSFLKKRGIGVRMVPLKEKVSTYQGEIAIRSLVELPPEDLQEIQTQITHFINEVKNRPYEKSMLEFIRAAYDGPFGDNIEEDLSSIFCSELVAAAYQRFGLLPQHPPGLPSNEYTPVDFSRNTLTLLKGKLSDIVPVKVAEESAISSEINRIF